MKKNRDLNLPQITSLKKMKTWLNDANIVGRRIVDIRLQGDEEYLNKQTFATWNMNRPGNTGQILRSVRRRDICDSDLRTRTLSVSSVIILDFDDGSNMAIQEIGVSELGLMRNYKGEYDGNVNVNIRKMFDPLIGLTIIGYEVKELPKGSPDSYYINKKIDEADMFKNIELHFDNKKHLYISDNAFAYMNGRNDPDVITMGEYIDCLPNWEQYFDE